MEKVYIDGQINNVRVGMCQVNLSDTIARGENGAMIMKQNSPVVLYDTSGPYGDAAFKADYTKGLPSIRTAWYSRRKDIVRQVVADNVAPKKTIFRARAGKHITQLYYAKNRVISSEMEYVAIRENQQVEALGLKSYITPDFVRKEIAAGRAVIPANINHVEIEPMVIGYRFLVKINNTLLLDEQFTDSHYEKIRLNCKMGVDTLMDISPEEVPVSSREYLIRNSPVPVGTPPIYQALAKVKGRIEDLSWEVYRDTLIEQLEQGVDFISVHAAMKRKHIKMTSNRLTGIVSRTGNILSEWMKIHKEENFLNTRFAEICEIAGSYDAVISLGSALRPGSVYDAIDPAHLAELSEMNKLIEIAWKQYVQIMMEGAGHIPMNKIDVYMKEYRFLCKEIPFFSSGRVTSDLAGSFENIAAAIGGAQMAWYGASLIGGIKSRTDFTDGKDLQTDLLGFKIAAHSVDLAKGHPGAQVRDNAFSKARQENRHEDCKKLSLVKTNN